MWWIVVVVVMVYDTADIAIEINWFCSHQYYYVILINPYHFFHVSISINIKLVLYLIILMICDQYQL